MIETMEQPAQDRIPVVGTAFLVLLGLLFPGMFVLSAVTDAVPVTDHVLSFAGAFYALTVMCGLILSLVVFGITGTVLRRSADPAIGWTRVSIVCALSTLVGFLVIG